MTAALAVAGVTKRFGLGSTDVIGPVALALRAGTLTSIRGEVGSGRTTLLRCLSGVYRPDQGCVTLTVDDASIDIAAADVRAIAWIRRHHLATFDGALAVPPRKPADLAVARSAGIEREAAAGALRELGLRTDPSEPIGRLRPAEQRTAALAAALWSTAPVVLLDDPGSAAPDRAVAARINALAAGGSAVLVTTGHDSAVDASATAVAVLTEGKQQWITR